VRTDPALSMQAIVLRGVLQTMEAANVQVSGHGQAEGQHRTHPTNEHGA